MKNLLIIGAGQYGMVAKEIAESMGCFDRIDFVDDVSEVAVGKICDIEKLVHEYDSAVVALGNPELRLKLINGLCEMGYNVPTLIHERAYVSPSAKISIGCFIEPMAVVHTGVVVETGVILNHNSVVHVIDERRPGDIATCYSNPSKAERELGWKAEHDIEDMCRDSWNWQKMNPDGYTE